MASPDASAETGVLHYIPPNLCAFEPTKALVKSADINTVIWIGGIGDTLLSVEYPLKLAQALGPTWSFMTVSLASAGKSWGVSSIARDADEVGRIVSYLRERGRRGKIVLMGHSTGSQDCIEYVVGEKATQRPAVDGIILQASVSDREALEMDVPKDLMQEANELALKMCREKRGQEAMPTYTTKPIFGRTSITAKRWTDIASPGPTHDGADDFFSSDLSDERLQKTFGKIPAATAVLILYGGSDEAVPKHVDKTALVERWIKIIESNGGSVDVANSGVVTGASHNLNGQSAEIVQDLIDRVNKFIARIDGGEFKGRAGANM